MDLDFTSEQNMLRESAAKFLADKCPFDRVKALEESEAGYDPELWQEMAGLGWTGLLFPEEYGGYGGEFTDLVIIQEEFGKAAYPSPFFSTVVQCGLIILEGGSEDQKKDLLPQIARGSLIVSLAHFEEEGSYLDTGITMRADQQGDKYVLNGSKLFVLDANIAEKLIVAARTDTGVTLLLVSAKDPGVTITRIPTIAKDNNCEVIFKDVTVSGDDIIGPAGGGWEILEKMYTRAALAKAAEMAGGSRTCLDMTSAYAKEREQYGKVIGGFQVIQHYLANMQIACDTAFNYLYRLAGMIDAGDEASTAVSAMKACINENFKFISERAVQIHGAIGTTREHNIGLFYRRAKSCEFMCGDSNFHYEKICDDILEKGIPEIL